MCIRDRPRRLAAAAHAKRRRSLRQRHEAARAYRGDVENVGWVVDPESDRPVCKALQEGFLDADFHACRVRSAERKSGEHRQDQAMAQAAGLGSQRRGCSG
eukprot:2150831-Rhodomonas_salina.3